MMKPEVVIYLACSVAVGAFLTAIIHGLMLEFRAKQLSEANSRLEKANKDLARQLATEKAAHDTEIGTKDALLDITKDSRSIAKQERDSAVDSLETANAEIRRLESLSADHYNAWKRASDELDAANAEIQRPEEQPDLAKEAYGKEIKRLQTFIDRSLRLEECDELDALKAKLVKRKPAKKPAKNKI